ncbi:MAG: hypothetical protein ABI539_05110 [Acidobacteriota bacterium]
MEQAAEFSKTAGKAGGLAAIIGMLVFFSGVFGITPRTAIFVGIALILISLIAFAVEERGSRP